METLIIIFMVFAAVICLTTFAFILIDVIHSIKKRSTDNRPEVKVETIEAPTPPPVAEPISEPAPEPEVEELEKPQEIDNENVVLITTGKTQTLEEKYLSLDADAKGWYDEIERFVNTKEGIKHFKNAKYEDYKIGTQRILRLTIKRGTVQCEFTLINQDFRNYINDNKVSVKTAATVIKIENAESVEIAKNTVDIAIDAVMAERQYKKEKQKEKRRIAALSNK